jgi:hypothetical protein
MENGMPTLDRRNAVQVLEELLRRRPAYVPELVPAPGGATSTLLQIFARYMEVVIDRLNQAPDKNLLAFLEMLGINLLPAQAARAPVVFQPLPNADNGRIIARTRVGAEVPGRATPVMFETESAIALAAARLVEVVSLWPARDAYADHTPAAIGGRPFRLFKLLQPVPHELYLAHDTLLAFGSGAVVEIEFELSTPGSVPLEIAWEYWDGQVWRPFTPFDRADHTASQDGTAGLTRSGVVTLRAECGQSAKKKILGLDTYWLRGRLEQPLPSDLARVLPEVDRIRLRTESTKTFASGLQPDAAFADGVAVDLSGSFYPFGQAPQPGSAFYFSSQEAFSKPRARITLAAEHARTPEENTGTGADQSPPEPMLVAEFWNGKGWVSFPHLQRNDLVTFVRAEGIQTVIVVLPDDISATRVNNAEGFWLRIRIQAGGFIRTRTIQWTDWGGETPKTNTVVVAENVPPAWSSLHISYNYRSSWQHPEHCLTYNDFQWALHSGDVRVPGRFFPPFRPVADTTPALYLGFDQPLPNDLVSVYLDIQESDVTTLPLVWEAWDGTTWREVSVNDETAGLQRPGMVSFIAPDVASRPLATVVQATAMQINTGSAVEAALFQPGDRVVVRQDETQELASVQKIHGATIWLETPLANTYSGDTVELAALPRFGTPHDWVRARLKQDSTPAESRINGLYLNAAWVVQRDTINDEVLGSGTEQPRQTVFFRQSPVLPGEQIEVRELEGARAAVELPILQEDLRQHGLTTEDIRTVSDPRTGHITEVWVRWQPRPHLFFSGPEDRHYMVDRASGRLLFGDGRYGRLPTVGANNIRARQYQAGGGLAGNVPADKITQLLSPAPFVEAVTNPRAADGGAEGETLAAVKTRGPYTLRHRGRALAARDYEALAREASPGVAVARALPAIAPNGRPAPGWVTVIIVPQSQEVHPQPSYELRRQVHRYLVARTPATVTPTRIAVIGPGYLPIGVAATVAPREASEAGAVDRRVHTSLMTFLHPLTGGPEGQGWPFGRHVYLSDVAAVLEAVDGVDYVTHLSLLLNDTPQDERVAVPPDRMVVAGPLHIELQNAER